MRSLLATTGLGAITAVMTVVPADAETVISTAVTTPQSTSASGDIRISSTGSVKPTTGVGVTLNTNNYVRNEGAIQITGANNSAGVVANAGVSGEITPSWQLVGGFSSQSARIRSRTTAAAAGATVPLVPRSTVSVWNRVQLAPALGAGLGAIRQARMYAAIDNSVTLPAFTRYDGALFLALPYKTRAQLNVENLLDSRYYATSQGNNNIMPGASRTVRLSLSAEF